MRKIKTYEKYIRKNPKKGDFIICKTEYYDDSLDKNGRITNFINSNIGIIVDIERVYGDDNPGVWFEIEYDFPSYFGVTSNIITCNETEIVKFSPNIQELEMFLDQNKFNL